MNIQEAKSMDLVDYLSTIGYQPVKINGNNYWYSSPLSPTHEKTPSFKVNRKLNSWFDWSEGRNIGGNLVDFGILYNKCSVSEFLQKLENNCARIRPLKIEKEDGENQIKITGVQPLSSFPLTKYLLQRKIPREIYEQHCKEVTYTLRGKSYYSIGFKNDAGGYELRNEYSKLSSSPKGITFIDNHANKLITFEGFFNFLSYRALEEKTSSKKQNYLILNSTSFFEKTIPLMQQHEKVHLYLDNDPTGQKFSQKALQLDPLKFDDKRNLYKDFKDLNDWLIRNSQILKHTLRQTL